MAEGTAAALAIENYLIEPSWAALPDPAIQLAAIAPNWENAKRSFEEQRNKFEELYREARALSPDELEIAIVALLDRERLLAAILRPRIIDAEDRLAGYGYKGQTAPQKTVVRLLMEAQQIATGWLELYQNLRIRLARLASEKLAAEGRPGSPIISSGEELDRYLRSVAPEDG